MSTHPPWACPCVNMRREKLEDVAEGEASSAREVSSTSKEQGGTHLAGIIGFASKELGRHVDVRAHLMHHATREVRKPLRVGS